MRYAEELAKRGASVQLVLGPTTSSIEQNGIKVHKVQTADEMYEACVNAFRGADIAIMSAAVADYTPANKAQEKIKKDASNLNLELIKTKDILKRLGEKKKAVSYW